jgi:hypothetical protein
VTVYVDDYRRKATVGQLTARWSHLLADTDEELLAFAKQLGLQPAWLQHEGTPLVHFDVTDQMRNRAIRAGAEPITYRQSGELVAGKRAALPRPPSAPAPQAVPGPSAEASRPLPKWNPATRRHAWIKVREHWSRCGHCDLVSENEDVGNGHWFRWWHWPDGAVTADVTTPKCPGPAAGGVGPAAESGV